MDLNEIFFVLVLYKNTLEESQTISSLNTIVNNKTQLFVFDNSPVRQYQEDNFEFLNFNVYYHNDQSNPGLSEAYNKALSLAKKSNSKWLLLLDQDTVFSREYIAEIKNLNTLDFPSSLVAIMPRVFSLKDNLIISPTKMILGGICRPITIKSGITDVTISGINSGTLLNVEYMDSIGGFSKKYTLDNLDHWYFRKIFKDQKKLYLLNSSINQNLSVMENFEENVSYNRYIQMLNSEMIFIKEEGFLNLIIFKFRLVFRIFKQLKFKNKNYLFFTLKQLLK